MTAVPYRKWRIETQWRGNRYRVSLFNERGGGMSLPGDWKAGSKERAIEFAKARIDMEIDGHGGHLSSLTQVERASKKLRQLLANQESEAMTR